VADGTLDTTPAELWPHVSEFFTLQIVPHFEIEERLLLPALAELGEAPMVERLRDEHGRLRGFAAMIDVTRAVLAEFGALLEKHIRFEEREVFEQMQDRLPQATLDAIAAACADTARICPTTLRPLGKS
jgi:hemerythrin-like domain-containing protein